MNEADADDFSRALEAAFPNVRFVSYEYWNDGKYAKRRADNLVVPYFDSLGDSRERRFRVWLQPDGWQPRWEGPNQNGIYGIVNNPRLQFSFNRSTLKPMEYEGRIQCRDIMEGSVAAYYRKDDEEHRHFLNKVWRITEKLTSNILDCLQPGTYKVSYPSQRTMVWVGYHAMDWCRQDPRRRISEFARPPMHPVVKV